MNVLVAYGSKHGSTAAIAKTVAESLRTVGIAADARPAEEVRDLDGYEAVARDLGARGHATFGGALAPDTTGFVAGRMARSGRAGDWRDFDRIQAWGAAIAAELGARQPG